MASQEGFDPFKLIQIIDKDGEFSEIDSIKATLTNWEISSKGYDYFVVAILGCQSSGKSTLLNLLFGTTFPVMDESEGRTQTTQGVWMGRARTNSAKEENILVFDVEGTDSRERGEAAASWERKSSLFALALSEVLLVNMWHNDVGRYNAGNISLLKTVFELNLQLFQQKTGAKKILLFVIRDHIAQGGTALDKLKAAISKDMTDIWKGLNKPDEFVNSKIEDFFEFQYTALSHKVLAAEEFNKGVENLRERFLDASSETFILGTDKDSHRTDVPADGFSIFASTIWRTIKENKDLNIPSQKAMLAIFRCDEISADVLKTFSNTVSPFRKTLEAGDIVEDFGAKASQAYQMLLSGYDQQALRYDKVVSQQKRETLSNSANDMLLALFTLQLNKLTEKSTVFFNKVLNDSLPADGKAATNFSKIKDSVVNSTLEHFTTRADACLVSGLGWKYEHHLNELKSSMNKQLDAVKTSQLQKLIEEHSSHFNASFGKHVERILDNPGGDMWPKIRSRYEDLTTKEKQIFKEHLQGFEISEEEAEKKVAELETAHFEVLKKRFTDKIKYLDVLLTKRFEQNFSMDSDNLPKRWKPSDDIPKAYAEAKQKGDELLEYFAVLRMNEIDDTKEFLDLDKGYFDELDPKLVVMPLEEVERVREKYRGNAQSIYKQAVREQEHAAQQGNVPYLLILLLIFFGFDEAVTVVSNPLLLILVVFVGGGLYLLSLLGMLGPVRTVVEATLRNLFHVAQNVVSEQVHQYHLHQQAKKDDASKAKKE